MWRFDNYRKWSFNYRASYNYRYYTFFLPTTVKDGIIHSYEDIEKSPQKASIITKPVLIGTNTAIYMGARIMPGVTIGKHCVIGANAIVTKNIPDYTVAVGVPEKPIKRFDVKSHKWIKLEEP